MPNPKIDIKEIKKLTIKGIVLGYTPILVIGSVVPWLDNLPPEIRSLLAISSLILFFYGYIVCFKVANQYSLYKGYKNYLYIYSFSNIFGLSILFLLKNRNPTNYLEIKQEPLKEFSILSIFTSWFAIPVVLIIPLYAIAILIMGRDVLEYYANNEDFLAISAIPIQVIFIWYFIRESKRAKINYKFIFGSFKKLNFKLPIKLAFAKYLLVRGINPPVLYSLSFIFPQYVEEQINSEYPTTSFGWLCLKTSTLIFAPVMEELIFRGIILQKITIEKNIIRGLITSAIFFTLMHFRFDVISLFIAGLIYAVLYLKTKQLSRWAKKTIK